MALRSSKSSGLGAQAFLEAAADRIAELEDVPVGHEIEDKRAGFASGQEAGFGEGLEVAGDIGLGEAGGLDELADVAFAGFEGEEECQAAGLSTVLPRMWGFQAAGAAPIVLGAPVAAPQTIATAIRIGNPASWQGAVAARDESGGLIEAVTDEEILAAYRFLAAKEGVFCEPASAAGVAGLLSLANAGRVPAGAIVVCVLTGHGLKDPDYALDAAPDLEPSPPDAEAVLGRAGILEGTGDPRPLPR